MLAMYSFVIFSGGSRPVLHRTIYFCDFSREGGPTPHARVPEFLSGGWGPRRLPENSSDVFFSFFLILNFNILQFYRGCLMVISKKTILFQGFRGSPTFSRGGGGGPNANFYRNPYNLSFSRGLSKFAFSQKDLFSCWSLSRETYA